MAKTPEEIAHHLAFLSWDDRKEGIATAIRADRARAEKVVAALREARPVVANAAKASDASPWQIETRTSILGRVDAALADWDSDHDE